MSEANDNAKGAGKFLDAETWEAMKKAGYSEEELQADQPLGPIIFSYTRKQAIEDGVLVDVSEIARQEGFVLSVCMTATLYGEITRLPAGAENLPNASKAWPMTMLVGFLRILRRQIRLSGAGSEVHFKVGQISAWALCGPGDEGEPVLTVMLEGED